MSQILYKLVKNNNEENNGYGKWYAKAVSPETVTFRQFINHIMSHGSVYDRGTVTGIMIQMLECLKELLLDSKRVKFGDFGTFYPSLSSTGVEDIKDFNTDTNIKGVHMRFLPNRQEGNDSVSLRSQVKFKSTAQIANPQHINALNLEEGVEPEENGNGE